MPPITIRTVIKLLLASLAVGAAMAFFGVTPQDVLHRALALGRDAFDHAQSLFGNALSYILLGAVVVIPVWIVLYLLRALKGRP
jgi:hypothetical protein